MKQVLLIIISLLFVGGICLAQVRKQKLIGLWQIDSPKTGDALLANYRFFPNGTFKYTLNGYDDQGRIAQARGTYRLRGDTLVIVIRSRIERVGGDLVQGGMGVDQDEIVLDGGKNIEVKQKNIEPIKFLIDWFHNKKGRAFKIQRGCKMNCVKA